MITPLDYGAVARWTWELDVPVRRQVELFEQAAEALASRGLLNPALVKAGKEHALGVAWEQRLHGVLRDEVVDVELGPLVVTLAGSTRLLDADGAEVEAEGAVLLHLEPGDEAAIVLVTHTDAWMAEGLTGAPQPEVARRNAPRLRAALADLDELLGPGEADDYGLPSVIDGHTVRLRRGVDGEPALPWRLEAWLQDRRAS